MAPSGEAKREDFPYRLSIPTRWMDNDMLGHVNNVVFYRYFEAIVVDFLTKEAKLDWLNDPQTCYAVESMCRFWKPLSYPETVEARLRIGHIGTSSVRYEVALFSEGKPGPAATGHFVHVFVDRKTERPTPIPASIKRAFERFR